jgi:uncharacterized delta-60 repeat protein
VGSGTNGNVLAIARQSDGKLILGGSFTSYNGSTTNRIVRLNADGSRDTTFLTGTTQGVAGQVNAIAIDPLTGRIVLGGNFTTHAVTTTSLNRIARFNADGSHDVTFEVGTGFNNSVNALGFDATSNVLVGGGFTSYNGTSNINRIVRLTATGAIDSTFAIGTGTTAGANLIVNSLAYDAAGNRWLVGGSFTSYNAQGTYNRLIRLSATGALDTTFNPNVNGNVLSLFVQPSDGAVVLGGTFTTVGGNTGFTRSLGRVSSAGVRDAAVTGVFRSPGSINRILPLPGGKFLVTGAFTHLGVTPATNLARLNSDLSRAFPLGSQTRGRVSVAYSRLAPPTERSSV